MQSFAPDAAMKRNPRLLLAFSLVTIGMGFYFPLARGQDATSLSQKAANAAQKGNLDEAITDWNEVIQLNPNNAKAYYNRGLAKADHHDPDGAMTDYNEAIQLDPKNGAAYNSRGYAKSQLGDLSGAILDYNQAIELDPKDPEAYNNRGNAKLALDDLNGAIADFNETIRLNPRHVHAYNGRGNASLLGGDYYQAITDFDQALHLDARYDHAYNGRGLAETAQGSFKLALADFTQAITLNPRYAHAYLNRALTAYDMGLLDEARQDFQKVAELDPTDVESHFFIWLIAASQPDQRVTADSDLRSFLGARQLAPWNRDLAYFLFGDMSQEELLEAAVSEDQKKEKGQLCQAYFYIGSKDELSGNKVEASDFFRRCVGTDQKDFTDFQVAQARVMAEVASTSPATPGPIPVAVWINGQISLKNGLFLFAADKPVRGNPLGNVVLLGSTRATAKAMSPIYAKAAEKHLTVRLYGCLLPFQSTIPNHPEALPNVEFIVWKLHVPGDPDILPPDQKMIILDPAPFEQIQPSPPGK
jgi:tetratricopeptide (TPR) repeat protein